jgi:micrococcal nuclease
MKYWRLLAIVTGVFLGAWILSYSFSSDEPAVIEVKRVIDGDTFVASIGGVVETVRLIGVDAPELGRCYSMKAKNLLEQLILKPNIWIAVGDQPRDEYDRLLAYVFHEDGRFVNMAMARAGAAKPMRISPNIEYANLIGEAWDEAAIAKRGGWSSC